MFKKAAALVGVLVVAPVLAHLYVQGQVYYPVVQVDLPDGLSVTAILPETKERTACGDANDRFLAPFRDICPQCKVAVARCERELDGVELALSKGEPLSHPMVVAKDMHIAVMGPSRAADASCRILADSMVKKGVKSAACIAAKPSPRQS